MFENITRFRGSKFERELPKSASNSTINILFQINIYIVLYKGILRTHNRNIVEKIESESRVLKFEHISSFPL